MQTSILPHNEGIVKNMPHCKPGTPKTPLGERSALSEWMYIVTDIKHNNICRQYYTIICSELHWQKYEGP